MGLFSFLRKNKQEDAASGQAGYQARAGEDAAASRTRAKRKTARETDEADIPEKKRARRRLIGAVVLVLIVVVVLPMVFDPEPNPDIDNIAIQIPSREQPSVAPADLAALEPATDAPAAAEDLEEVVSPGVVDPAPAAASTPAAQAAPTSAPTPGPVAAAPAARPAPAAPAPAATPPSRQDDAARALAILEGRAAPAAKPAAKQPAATGGKFVIQVAALASQEKVAELRKKLSDAGIKSFTQKIATKDGERTRIRVGPFTGKEEAEKMRARINKLGLNATLVPA